ncbi:FtsX-like permease family protein [Anaerohalosphaeraceae bacterium U12dextr]
MKQWSVFLCLRYLSRKRIVLLSMTAVMLCCALLITVASLFTGFIRSVEDSVGDYLGDVILSAPGTFKIEEYADFQQQLVGLSVVKAATPVLSGNGLLLTGPGQIRAAQILGIDLKNQLRVSPLKDALIRQKNLPDEQVAFGEFADKAEIGGFVGIGLIDDPDEMTDSYDMPTVESFIGRKAAVTTGTLVEQVPAESDPAAETAGPRFTRKVLRFTIADVVQTGVYEFDQAFVYVPIEALSSLLYPDRKPCCESFQIALEPGADEEKAMAMIRGLWLVYAQDRYPWAQQVEIQSSRQMQALLIAEYHKQLNMLMLIFGIVSFGVVLLVFCIFYLIVMTRQKDIAIVKSCGASSLSVAGMYLLFGLVNGVLGSLLGAGLGWLITRNIEIIEKGITAMTGLKIWKASTYLFTKIPNEVNWQWAFWICIAALAAAAVGALIPAVAAARIRPVRLLRYE